MPSVSLCLVAFSLLNTADYLSSVWDHSHHSLFWPLLVLATCSCITNATPSPIASVRVCDLKASVSLESSHSTAGSSGSESLLRLQWLADSMVIAKFTHRTAGRRQFLSDGWMEAPVPHAMLLMWSPHGASQKESAGAMQMSKRWCTTKTWLG